MNAQPKKARAAGYFEGSLDAKIKTALSKAKGLSCAEKVKLYNALADACRVQVEDCCDSITAALYLVLHDDKGYGQKRINCLKDRTQETLDAYVEKYEIATVTALYRDLAARGIIIKPRREGEE